MNRIDLISIIIILVIEVGALAWFTINGIFGVLSFILVPLILFNIWKLYTFFK